jgi:hypothetical protein
VLSSETNPILECGDSSPLSFAAEPLLASIRLTEIPVRVSLRVRFELLKVPPKIEQAVLKK